MRKGWKGELYSGMELNSEALRPGLGDGGASPLARTSLLLLFLSKRSWGALPIQLTEKEQSKGSC